MIKKKTKFGGGKDRIDENPFRESDHSIPSNSSFLLKPNTPVGKAFQPLFEYG